jgi:nucleotide-binding universal stress UspA family protein
MATNMESFKTIMFATDLSDASCGALSYATRLASLLSAKLVIVHVVDPVPVAQLTTQSRSILRGLIDSAEDELQRTAMALSNDLIRHATIVRVGPIRETLLQLIDERGVDLLVIGTSGKAGTNEEAMGSVAEMLLRAMPCPVLTVGRCVRQDAFEGTHLRLVLFPTDFSEVSYGALSYAESLTRYISGRLLLLHVDERVAASATTGSLGERAKFETLVKTMDDPAMVAEYISCGGPPAGAIVAAATEKHADFIVLGVHTGSARAEARPLIAYDVIRTARCPVLTICPIGEGAVAGQTLQDVASV